jgi:hypothetical protein
MSMHSPRASPEDGRSSGEQGRGLNKRRGDGASLPKVRREKK